MLRRVGLMALATALAGTLGACKSKDDQTAGEGAAPACHPKVPLVLSRLPVPGAPAGRTQQGAVWTGSELIVWGGRSGATALADGGRFDVAAGAWKAVAGGGASKRLSHAMVWTGSEMIVWGGTNTFDWLGDGK